RDAELILHVRDISHPESDLQADNVVGILGDLGIETGEGSRILEVWNKTDRLPGTDREALLQIAERTPRVAAISAQTGQGIDALRAMIEREVVDAVHDDMVQVGFGEGQKRAWLFDHKLVTSERQGDAGYEIDVRWTERDRERFSRL